MIGGNFDALAVAGKRNHNVLIFKNWRQPKTCCAKALDVGQVVDDAAQVAPKILHEILVFRIAKPAFVKAVVGLVAVGKAVDKNLVDDFVSDGFRWS